MTQTRIEEQGVPGKRLCRHINHGPRSRSYALTAKVPTLVSTVHEQVAPSWTKATGPCPPNDMGSSGLSGAAALQAGSPAVTSTASPWPTPSPPDSLARYRWLKDGGTLEDSARQQDHILGAVGGVEVVIDPTRTGMDYNVVES